MENEGYIPRRNQVLFTLIEGDALVHESGGISIVTDGELWIYSDRTTRSIGAEFKHLGAGISAEYLANRSRGNQVILMETLEEI